MKFAIQIAAALGLLSCLPHATAQQTFLFHDVPTVSEYKAILFGEPGAPKLLTRGIRLKSGPKADAPNITALPVPFAFDSAEINIEIRPYLDNLAIAMKSKEGAGHALQLTGHTDTVGAADYNVSLSNRRALAVRAYLVAHGVDPAAISSAGVGASEPLPGYPGDAPDNRRVDFKSK